MILNVGSALIGQDLTIERNVSIEVEGGIITLIRRGFRSNGLTFKHGVALPALVNAHLHVLDYAFQEAGLNLSLKELVSEPHGLKHKLISSLSHNAIKMAASRLFSKLAAQGIYKAIIFCEKVDFAKMLKLIAEERGLKAYVLIRPIRLNSKLYLNVELLEELDGLGLDSPLRYSPHELEYLSLESSRRGKLKSTHVAETRESYAQGDFKLAMDMFKPHIVVHGIHLTEDDIESLASNNISLVLCPRSNMWFSSGMPMLKLIFKHNVNVLLGTDNAGWIEPDIWRELEALYLLCRLQGLDIDPKEILKIATINVQRVKGLKAINNVLDEGLKANFIVIDGESLGLDFSHNIYASIVKRASQSSVIYKVININ